MQLCLIIRKYLDQETPHFSHIRSFFRNWRPRPCHVNKSLSDHVRDLSSHTSFVFFSLGTHVTGGIIKTKGYG